MFDGGTFFRVITGLSVACSLGLAGPVEQAAAGEVKFFRIATGSTGGTYFPIGSIIASAISNPPGSRACADGGSCGIPGLIAVAQTTRGSVENIELITAGKVESGLCQADVAHQTYFGKGLLAGNAAYQKLRVVASLYPELVHVAVRKHRGIFKIEDLRGKRVSLGAQGSGTAVDAANILAAFGLGEGDYQAFHLAPGESSDRLQAGEIDAFFVVGGTPFPALRDLTEVAEIDLLPIEGARA
ncbi:MAG: TAXI family TRAP transporter solute-binding subunit, partial [Alphaproteobacteria bacterium]|nr:TAXI family TRAP transporter solute-binding subunit [Alphaproteobacteria bacterium]